MKKVVKGSVFIVASLLVSNVAAQDFDLGIASTPAQTQAGEFSGLPLDLLPPGARALGLGGAFTAVADDATAALANPAGLTNLSAAEVSVHLRDSDTDVFIFDPDAYSSAVNFQAGDLNKEFNDSNTNVSFASFVVPFENMTISGFYSSQVDFNATQSRPDELWDDFFLDGYTNINAVKTSIENYGLSAAFRLTDRLSMGLTVKNAKLDLQTQDIWQSSYFNDFEFVLADALNPGSTEEEFVADAATFQGVFTDQYDYRAEIDDSDTDATFDLGLLYKGEKWSTAVVFHQGAEFKVNSTGTVSTAPFACAGDADDPFFQICQAFDDFQQDGFEQSGGEGDWQQRFWQNSIVESVAEINTPDIWSFGLTWRPVQTFLVSLDINRISYADLIGPRRLTQGFGIFVDGVAQPLDVNNVEQRTDFNLDGTGVAFTDPEIASLQGPLVEEISDETTFHVGVEKFFTFQSGVLRTLALRGGAFTIEDHDGNALTNNDETVFTVGLGTTWGTYGGDRAFQLDIAASFADETTNVILSGIFRF